MYTGVYKDNELVATGLVLIKRLRKETQNTNNLSMI